VRALIVDDHPLFREALAFALSRVEEDAVSVQADSLEQATSVLADDPSFDLVLLDLGLPGAGGLAGVMTIRSLVPTTPIVVVSAAEDPELVQRAVRLGISGYITKSSKVETMHAALSRILAGDTHFPQTVGGAAAANPATPSDGLELLTPRQLTVLRLLGDAKSNKQIAYELSISQETVKIHISAILRKLGVSSRAQATMMAFKMK